ncbi:hypothetical protein HMPREF1139_0961 [Campylobacter sp. FOBRC14]|nr:hypothetical protein HMPREF1139_0961 [Campylobacter sp. FOBRC14]
MRLYDIKATRAHIIIKARVLLMCVLRLRFLNFRGFGIKSVYKA